MPSVSLFNNPAETQYIIDRSTVWKTCLHNDGRRYHYQYEAYDKDMLVKYAAAARASIDRMRSPSLTIPALQLDGKWAIQLTYYGLD